MVLESFPHLLVQSKLHHNPNPDKIQIWSCEENRVLQKNSEFIIRLNLNQSNPAVTLSFLPISILSSLSLFSVCLSVSPTLLKKFSLSSSMSISPSIHLSLSIYLSISLSLSVSPSVCLCLCLYLSIYLFLYISLYLICIYLSSSHAISPDRTEMIGVERQRQRTKPALTVKFHIPRWDREHRGLRWADERERPGWVSLGCFSCLEDKRY